jgi:cytochrome c556
MYKKIIAVVGLISLMLVATTGATAKEAQSEKQAKAAIKYRQAILRLVVSNMGTLGGMAKGVIPFNAEKVNTNGMRIGQLSNMMPDYFAIDTTKFDLSTDALPKIWDNMDDFKSKIKTLQSAASGLQKVTDEAGFKSAFGDLRKSCKGCHDEYKVE